MSSSKIQSLKPAASVRIMLILAALLGLLLSLPAAVSAQNAVRDKTCEGIGFVTGQECEESSAEDDESTIVKVAQVAVNILVILGAVVAVIMIIYGAFRFIASGGDSNATAAARKTIIYAIVGLIIILFVRVIASFVIGVLTDAADSTEDSDTEMVEEVEGQEVINLFPVGTNSGSGVATRTTSGTFFHEVIASIEDPDDGTYYEAWLIGDSTTSTGRLSKVANGQWSLSFTSSLDLRDFKEVVVSVESETNGQDGVIEVRVLEGNFE